MSLKPIDMVTIICDECGQDFFKDDESRCCLRELADEIAMQAEWETENGRHVCFNCRCK